MIHTHNTHTRRQICLLLRRIFLSLLYNYCYLFLCNYRVLGTSGQSNTVTQPSNTGMQYRFYTVYSILALLYVG